MDQNYFPDSAGRIHRETDSDRITQAFGVDYADNRGGVRLATVAWMLFLATMTLTFAVLLDNVTRSTGMVASDLHTVRALAAVREPLSTAGMRLISGAGSPAAMVALAAVVCGWLAWQRGTAEPLIVGAVGVGGIAALDTATKDMVARARPPVALHAAAAHGYSFPSGHASFSATVIPLCAVLIVRWVAQRTWQRVTLWVCAVLAIAAVGFSRVFLGVHYPSDVLAGWSLAGAWDVVVMFPMRLLRPPPSAPYRSAAASGSGSAATPSPATGPRSAPDADRWGRAPGE